MKCNGCGGELGRPHAIFGYGNIESISYLDVPQIRRENVYAMNYVKTLCPRCQHVLKDILLSSDLSDHWEKYEWTMMGDAYSEEYDG